MAMTGTAGISMQAKGPFRMAMDHAGGGGRVGRLLRPGLRFCYIGMQKQPPRGCTQNILFKEMISKIVSVEMLLHERHSVNMQLGMNIGKQSVTFSESVAHETLQDDILACRKGLMSPKPHALTRTLSG